MVTLNRASRNAAQASQKNAASHDRIGQSSSAQVCTRIAGARPKEIRSASESSCRPNGEVAPISRATKPSAMSSTIETAMSAAATVKWPSKASMTEDSPLIMFSVVKALGASSRARSRLGSCRSETTRAPVGDTSRQRSRIRRRPCAAGLVMSSSEPGAPSGR